MRRNRRNLKLKALEIYRKKKQAELEKKNKLDEIKEKLENEKKVEKKMKELEEKKRQRDEVRKKLEESENLLKDKEKIELDKILEEEKIEKEKLKKKKEEERKELEKILAEKEKAIIKEQEKKEYEDTRLDIFSYTKDPPFLYIDYSDDYIELAQGFGYKTIKIEKKNGISSTAQKELLERTDLVAKTPNVKYNIIINCWKVLTLSNLNSLSFDSSNYTKKKFSKKMNETIKWGNKQYLKNRLTEDQKKYYSVFHDGIPEFIEKLYNKGYNIFIISNSNYSFVKDIFKFYKLDKFITAIFTPSVCGIHSGSMNGNIDGYNDKRKINKERVFTCIEKYVGRMY